MNIHIMDAYIHNYYELLICARYVQTSKTGSVSSAVVFGIQLEILKTYLNEVME